MSKEDKTYFDSIMTGLTESLEYSRGNLPNVKKRTVSITPVPKYDAITIRKIRNSLNLTQMIFAEALGVSIKTVEAWESGRNHPQGPASRVLQLLEMDSTLLEEHKILCV
ncbi:helix-turn-helix domain-containing protein [Spirochaeta isovalerica]|uniref:Putative transcriptional regulator n=1 Tax=Spirochaeta isovalerica TaxID=150 RepID=A0A841RIZ1_9SPIO|nr:helix-turn-helix domain-containing protein [Spirochaeta isovalerica]MBB6482679.1 putative transcriptional regulator [Spirochaeta isovalerica]